MPIPTPTPPLVPGGAPQVPGGEPDWPLESIFPTTPSESVMPGQGYPYGFIKPEEGLYTSVVVPWINNLTGERWTAPHPGYTPPEGSGWVRGGRGDDDPRIVRPTPPTTPAETVMAGETSEATASRYTGSDPLSIDAQKLADAYLIPFDSALRSLSRLRNVTDGGGDGGGGGGDALPPLAAYPIPNVTADTEHDEPGWIRQMRARERARGISAARAGRPLEAYIQGDEGQPEERWRTTRREAQREELRRITGLGYYPELIPWLDRYHPPAGSYAGGGMVRPQNGIPIQNALASLAARRGQTPQGFLGGLDTRGIGGI